MATVLVDYENVCGRFGLLGAEYLNERDNLILFYSAACSNINRYDVRHIEESGCSFRVCELRKSRKNAWIMA